MNNKITPFADNEATTTTVFNQRIEQMNTALQDIDNPETGSIPKIQQEVSQLQSDVDAELAAQSKQLTAIDVAKAAKSITAPVTLTAADWVEDAENGWWTQGVSNPAIVDGRKIDISASPAVVKQISEAGATLVLENNAGSATIYSLGAVPTVDLTIELIISEVNTQ